jgi:hypothetical protein
MDEDIDYVIDDMLKIIELMNVNQDKNILKIKYQMEVLLNQLMNYFLRLLSKIELNF